MFYLEHKPHAGHWNHPPGVTEWSHLLLHDVVANAFHFCAAGGDGSAQHVYLSWHSNSSEQGTKHVFCVNLEQIWSTVSEIFDSQTKKNKKVTDSAKNRTLRSSLRTVTKWSELKQKKTQNAKPRQIHKAKPTLNFRSCTHMCISLSRTQHRTVLIIFPLILQTIIIAHMLFTEGEVPREVSTMSLHNVTSATIFAEILYSLPFVCLFVNYQYFVSTTVLK